MSPNRKELWEQRDSLYIKCSKVLDLALLGDSPSELAPTGKRGGLRGRYRHGKPFRHLMHTHATPGGSPASLTQGGRPGSVRGGEQASLKLESALPSFP